VPVPVSLNLKLNSNGLYVIGCIWSNIRKRMNMHLFETIISTRKFYIFRYTQGQVNHKSCFPGKERNVKWLQCILEQINESFKTTHKTYFMSLCALRTTEIKWIWANIGIHKNAVIAFCILNSDANDKYLITGSYDDTDKYVNNTRLQYNFLENAVLIILQCR